MDIVENLALLVRAAILTPLWTLRDLSLLTATTTQVALERRIETIH